VLFDAGDEITVQAGDKGIRFLLVSGKPIRNRSPGMARSS
jgi:redox-sensitive bicupin YhaK (pirin superfamily)